MIQKEKYSPEVSGKKILERIVRLLSEGTPTPLKKEWVIWGFSNLWNKRHNDVIDFENGFSYLLNQNLIEIKGETVIPNIVMVMKQEDQTVSETKALSKIFISHASKDKEYVKLLIKALKEMGVSNQQIYCSSFEGYGVPADGDILEWIKNGLTDDVLVLFVLSPTYFTRPICMCEMGAAWVQAKKYIPILIPPLEFDQIRGAIPLSKKAYKIDDISGLSSIKKVIEENFNINPVDFNIWTEFLTDYKNGINSIKQADEQQF